MSKSAMILFFIITLPLLVVGKEFNPHSPQMKSRPANQGSPTKHSLLSPPVEVHFTGSPVVSLGQLGSERGNSLIVGAHLDWILECKYGIGVGVFGLSNRIKAPQLPQVDGLVLVYNYAGLQLSYIHNAHHLLHWQAAALVGVGQAFYRDDEYFAKYDQNDTVIVLEPSFSLLLNVLPGIRLGGGVSYRYSGRVDLLGLSNRDLSALQTRFTILIGSF